MQSWELETNELEAAVRTEDLTVPIVAEHPTLPHQHYVPNILAAAARFCYSLRDGLSSHFRRIPCSTICARS
jgi:hypothetical protein